MASGGESSAGTIPRTTSSRSRWPTWSVWPPSRAIRSSSFPPTQASSCTAPSSTTPPTIRAYRWPRRCSEVTMIERTQQDGILTIRLAHGKVSAIDIELVEALARAFAEIPGDDDVRAVILPGTGSTCSAGVDLFRLVAGGPEHVDRLYPALSRMLLDLFTLPRPLVVAVNGHAIAGGCIFALMGDYRLMAG